VPIFHPPEYDPADDRAATRPRPPPAGNHQGSEDKGPSGPRRPCSGAIHARGPPRGPSRHHTAPPPNPKNNGRGRWPRTGSPRRRRGRPAAELGGRPANTGRETNVPIFAVNLSLFYLSRARGRSADPPPDPTGRRARAMGSTALTALGKNVLIRLSPPILCQLPGAHRFGSRTAPGQHGCRGSSTPQQRPCRTAASEMGQDRPLAMQKNWETSARRPDMQPRPLIACSQRGLRGDGCDDANSSRGLEE
jgi:hypothetical protein